MVTVMRRWLLAIVAAAQPLVVQAQGRSPLDSGIATYQAPAGGDLSNRYVTPNGGTTARTQAARAADVKNILDWALPADNGDYGLAVTRLCASVPGDFEIFFPGSNSTYAWNISVTTCGGRNITLRGAGKSVTKIAWGGTGVMFDVTQAYQTQPVTMRDLTISSTSPTGSLAALRVTYPLVGSSNRPTVTVDNVEVTSPTSGVLAGSFCKAVMLVNAWYPRIIDLDFTAQGVSPAPVGCAAVDAAGTRDITLSHVKQFNGDAVFYQSGYDEGVIIESPSAVGTNWLISQASSGITPGGGGVYGVGLTVNNAEINTYYGGFNMTHWHSAGANHNHFTKFAAGTEAFTGYNLSDATDWHGDDDVFEGGANGTISYVVLTAGTISTSGNKWSNPSVGNTTYLANFGAGTSNNSILDAFNRLGTGNTKAAVVDAGTADVVTEVTATGQIEQYEPLLRQQPNGVTETITTNGHHVMGRVLLVGSTTGGAGVRLTTDGSGTANGGNCIPVPTGAAFALKLTLNGVSPTLRTAEVFPLVSLSNLGAVATAPAASNLSPLETQGSATTAYIGPDATNSCLQVTLTPASGEAWNYEMAATITGYTP